MDRILPEHAIAFQVDDGTTALTFYDISWLVDELIADVANIVSKYASTRGSCSRMEPPMPLHEAYNHFALYLSDPSNLDRYKARLGGGGGEHSSDNSDSSNSSNSNSVGDGDSFEHADPDIQNEAMDGIIVGYRLQEAENRLRSCGVNPNTDAVFAIRRSYARLLQTFALAQVLLLLENEAADMHEPPCPVPVSLVAYGRILPILRRIACQTADRWLQTVAWCDVGAYWREAVDGLADQTYFFGLGEGGNPRRHESPDGSDRQVALVQFRARLISPELLESQSSSDLDYDENRIFLPPWEGFDEVDGGGRGGGGGGDDVSNARIGFSLEGVENADHDNSLLHYRAQRFLMSLFVTPENMRGSHSEWQSPTLV